MISGEQSDKKTGYLFAMLGGMCWALAGVCGQYLFQSKAVTAEWLVPVRLVSAGVIILLVACFRKGKGKAAIFSIWQDRNNIVPIFIFALVGTALCQYAFFASISASNAATATFISYISPIFIMIYVVFRTKRIPARLELLSILLVIIGIFIIATHGNIDNLVISAQALIWGIISAASFAVYSIQPQRLMRKHDTLIVTGWGMLIAGAALFVLFKPWIYEVNYDLSVFLSLSVLVLFGTILSYVFYLEGIKRVGATAGSLLSSVEPIVATLLSALWLGQHFAAFDFIGFAFILIIPILLSRESLTKADRASR